MGAVLPMGYTRRVRNKHIMEKSYPSILLFLLSQHVNLMKTLNSFRLNLTCLIYTKMIALHTLKIEYINVLQNCLPYKQLMLRNYLHWHIFIEKLSVAELVRKSLALYEAWKITSCPQESAVVPYSELD
jgi:hypothetical protein